MSFLLQLVGRNVVPFLHCSFHLCGTDSIHLSLKLSFCGQIPLSMIPIFTSLPYDAVGHRLLWFSPRNLELWVVNSLPKDPLYLAI
uniref:Uncharacterized protein n=1 Tax=Rhizophora mucronata TaxID=61149 RepID=A0A2P2IXQ7_RHIMU